MTAIGTIHGMLRRLASLRSQALLPASATVLLLALATVLLLAAAGCALLASPPRLTGPGPVPGDSHGAAVATGVSARLDEGQAESLPQGALASGKGQVAITVVWPVRPPGYRGQFIPDSTTRVLFDVVTGSNGFVASQSVNRPPTATSSIASFELDAGTYKLNVYAQLGAAASPSATATASSGFEVVAGARKSLGLTLSPVFPPALSGLSAGSGLAGDALTLNGTNLGLSWVATPTVKFSGNGGASVSATVSAMTPTSLTVTVPAEFVTGPIDVTVDGLKVTSGTFVAGSLRFWAIRPAPASASDTITLEGEFGGSATVNFPGNVTAPATILGPNRAKVVVPAGATAGSLTVTGGGNTTTALPFRAPSYSLGLGSLFQTGYPQADGALQSTTIQTARHQFGSAVIGKYLYILGGDNGNLNSVERATIDAAGNLSDFSTVIGVTLVTARAVFGTAVIGNYLYVFGGNAGGSHLNSVERAPIDGSGSLGAFSTVNGVTLVTGRQTFGSAVIGSYLYIFGGSSGGDFLASVERAPIDAAGNLGAFAVVNGVTLTTGRSEPGVEIIGNSVYLLGGNNGVNLASVERATIDGSGNLGNFAVVGGVTLASARRTFQSARLGNYLYILGGVGASVLTSVERALIDGSGNLGTFSSVAGVNLAVPRGYFGSAIIGNSLYAFGGYNDSGLLTSVERAGLNASGTLGSFTSGSLSLAVARANQAVAVAGNSLFVLGGSAERDLLSSIERAQLNADGTLGGFATLSTSLPTGRRDFATAVIGNYLYVVGGYDDGGPKNSIIRAALNADGSLMAFENAEYNLDVARGYHKCVVIRPYLYAIAGFAGSHLSSVVSATLHANGTLRSNFGDADVSLLTPRNNFTTAVIGDYLYVIGGQNSSGQALSSVERALIRANGTLRAFQDAGVTLAEARYSHASAIVGDHLYVFGGRNSGTRKDNFERAKINSDGSLGAFSIVPGQTLALAREGLTGAVLGNYLYLLGGSDGSPKATVERSTLQ